MLPRGVPIHDGDNPAIALPVLSARDLVELVEHGPEALGSAVVWERNRIYRGLALCFTGRQCSFEKRYGGF